MFFKRKEKYPLNAKYQINDLVNFRYKGELYFGYIDSASSNKENKITYVIQIGGECPTLVYQIDEDSIVGLIKKRKD